MSEQKLAVLSEQSMRSFIKQLSDPFGPVDRIGSGVITMPQAMAHLESENAQLKTRLREIEAELQTERKSRLEWHPVSEGLPTEHADYEFTMCNSEQVNRLDLVRLTHEGFELVLSAETFGAEELLDNVDFTHYRRIELPAGGES